MIFGAAPTGGVRSSGAKRNVREDVRSRVYLKGVPMGEDNNRDTGRQVANVLGALLQIVVPIFTGEAINQVSSEGPGSLVAPAGYAFIIWGPITLLSLAYAVYQALPFKRKDPLLRRVG